MDVFGVEKDDVLFRADVRGRLIPPNLFGEDLLLPLVGGRNGSLRDIEDGLWEKFANVADAQSVFHPE
ncbi:hypothetical protein ACFQH8_01650 [Halomicroarcula sp. GCM10025710]